MFETWLSIPRKPAPAIRIREDTPMRSVAGQYTASPRELERRRRAASVNAQLGVYVALTTPEQRRAETEAHARDAVAEGIGL
jgi:hypothetical protein